MSTSLYQNQARYSDERLALKKIWEQDPEKALDIFLANAEKYNWMSNGKAQVLMTVEGLDGKSYCQSTMVSREYLKTRKYEIDWTNWLIGLTFTDVWHDPVKFRSIRREDVCRIVDGPNYNRDVYMGVAVKMLNEQCRKLKYDRCA